ncbi:MAG: hypothetical protein JSW13_04735, partial [Candidatus Aerophobus sp.]
MTRTKSFDRLRKIFALIQILVKTKAKRAKNLVFFLPQIDNTLLFSGRLGYKHRANSIFQADFQTLLYFFPFLDKYWERKP